MYTPPMVWYDSMGQLLHSTQGAPSDCIICHLDAHVTFSRGIAKQGTKIHVDMFHAKHGCLLLHPEIRVKLPKDFEPGWEIET